MAQLQECRNSGMYRQSERSKQAKPRGVQSIHKGSIDLQAQLQPGSWQNLAVCQMPCSADQAACWLRFVSAACTPRQL
jgi:hypothetical protein